MDQIGLGFGLVTVAINVEVTRKDEKISKKERLVSVQVLLYCFTILNYLHIEVTPSISFPARYRVKLARGLAFKGTCKTLS